jgi:uncharacterized protein (TIGR03118 family)
MQRFVRTIVGAAVLTLALAAAGPVPAAPPGGTFTVTPLVSDVSGGPAVTDPNLVNAWGLTRSGTSPWWVADNATKKATLYNSAGAINSIVVAVDGGPTGAVFAGIDGNFLVATDASTDLARASFIFDGEDGMIRAWRAGGTALVTAAGDPDAIFKGLAIAQPTPGHPLLYAADFHNARVDVFDGAWQNVTPAGSFADPTLPSGYAPFGIQTIGDRVFVTYGMQQPGSNDEAHGQGLGIVDAYDLGGKFLARVAQHGQLDAPWGVAWAPASFGRFGGDLLVGNFGDGQVNAYQEMSNGHFEHRGTLHAATHGKLSIDGLWALEFGNAGPNGDPQTLFFTAGIQDEAHGLFGTITPTG